MIRKRYYLIYSALGFATASGILLALLNGVELAELYSGEKSVLPPLFVALATLLYLAHYFDQHLPFQKGAVISQLILKPLVLYYVCISAGCFVNYLIHSDFQNFFLKPFYAFALYGIPGPILVSFIFYFFANRYGNLEHQNENGD